MSEEKKKRTPTFAEVKCRLRDCLRVLSFDSETNLEEVTWWGPSETPGKPWLYAAGSRRFDAPDDEPTVEVYELPPDMGRIVECVVVNDAARRLIA